MKWISILDELPKIPEGKYGVPVLVAMFDPIYEELCPGWGYTVTKVNYGYIFDRNKKILPQFLAFNYNELDGPQFMELYLGTPNNEWGPVLDEITHWMYLPKPPLVDEYLQYIKNRE